MEEEKCAFSSFLHVGARASITPRPQSRTCPRYSTVLRGWEHDQYLIFDLPALDGAPVNLSRDQDIVIRLVSHGSVCAFHCLVLQSFSNSTSPHFCVRWPQQFETMEIRQHQRLDVSIPCRMRLEDGQQAKGLIQDISNGGCRIDTAVEAKPGSHLAITFTLSDGSQLDDVECIVRNLRRGSEDIALGVQFSDVRTHVAREIQFYITTSLARLRGHGDTRPRVLIFSDRDDTDELLKLLEAHGIDAIAASDPVDAMYRLRLYQPSVVILDHEAEGRVWTPLALCAMTREAPAVNGVKIMLGGREEQSEAAGAAEIGINAFLTPRSSPETILEMLNNLLSESVVEDDSTSTV